MITFGCPNLVFVNKTLLHIDNLNERQNFALQLHVLAYYLHTKHHFLAAYRNDKVYFV